MLKKIFITGIFILLFMSSIGHGKDDSKSWTIKTAEDAKTKALEYTGFSKLRSSGLILGESAELVVMKDDKTPFLHDSINNRNCWRVEIILILRLERKFSPDSTGLQPRKYHIFLDAETGKLFRISSVLEEDYEHKPPMLHPDTAERKLREMKEIFHGFPDEKPVISFLDALNYVLKSPFLAKEIHASYVVYSTMGCEPHPVWWIDLRGIPPIMMIGGPEPYVPIEKRNHMRSVIDARTGTHIRSSTLPG